MKQWAIGLISVFLAGFTYAQSLDCTAHHCMAVADAGSTGTRLRVYTYDLDDKKNPYHIEEAWVNKVSPGLATLTPAAVPNYLNGLVKNLPDVDVPVYFYATAGVRLLPKSQQDTLYQAVTTWFANQSHWQLKEAKTISGSDEGIYGWAATNYQLGRFDSNNEPFIGFMDMGGASVQIAFPVSQPEGIPSIDLKTIHVGGRAVTLFVHSFLGLGQTEVVHQLIDSPACYAPGYPLPNQKEGIGDVNQCEKKAELLMHVHDVSRTVQQALLTNPVHNWFASGGLSMLAQKEPLHFDGALTPDTLLSQSSAAFCEVSWNQLESRYSTDSYLGTNCLSTAYYHALLVKGYGFTPQQEVQFSTGNTVGEWSLGVVVLQ